MHDARIFAAAYALGCALAFRWLVPVYLDQCFPTDEVTTASCTFVRKLMAFYKISPLLVAGSAAVV